MKKSDSAAVMPCGRKNIFKCFCVLPMDTRFVNELLVEILSDFDLSLIIKLLTNLGKFPVVRNHAINIKF